MMRIFFGLLLVAISATGANAQTMTLSTSNADFQITNAFSDVDLFNIEIGINAPLAAGLYNDPEIISVTYRVQGSLVAGTPSGFSSFNLQRTITGANFYAQGSSLRFEISPSAVLTDGVQVAELVGSATVLTFNGREIDNGRYHPALFELSADGTGRIQNSNNIHTSTPLVEVTFGEEYITDLLFDPGNTTVIISEQVMPAPAIQQSGGGGALLPVEIGVFVLLAAAGWSRRRRRRR